MKLIDELFKRYSLDNESKLLSYGFINIDNEYKYSKSIHNNDFTLNIKIINNIISGALIDATFGDIYNQIDLDVTGSFVTELKEECKEVLLDIRDKCFSDILPPLIEVGASYICPSRLTSVGRMSKLPDCRGVQ